MSVAAAVEVVGAAGRAPAGAGAPSGVEVPVGLGAGPCRARPRPARAVRIGSALRPRVRPLADVLAELVRSPATPPAAPSGPATPVPPVEPAPPAPAADPRLREVVVRLLQAVVEVLDGARPPGHLRRVGDEGVLDGIVALVPPPGRPRRPRSRLRGVRVCPVAPAAVEVAGVVHGERRARALAGRLEHDGQGWRFTALDVL